MRLFSFLILSLIAFTGFAQSIDQDASSTDLKLNEGKSLQKKLKAIRTTAAISVDGRIDEEAWKEASVAKDFVEWRPNAGAKEAETNKTVVYFLYDNFNVYIAGHCYEQSRDSVSRELIGRDKVGINDFAGVILDTYNDKINGVGFYVTPYGEQFDAKYSNTAGEDGSWNAVWESAAQIVDNGWTFEMRIPYSALRFVSSENQTWGMNITRRRNKTGQQYMWNPIDPKINGFINQEGEWYGIGKIEAPMRLSFSPYLSTYLNHYPANGKGNNFASSINGGMDVKYGINDAFTLDMTLIPDFGQVRSDNQVLNLSPFEVQFNENRNFFTEGTELFNKGNLFYSRRIGATPLNFGNAYRNLGPNEYVKQNPTESKLLNATKISGRTKSGLGLGLFNAVTKPMYAIIEDSVDGKTRELQTNSFTNYNIVVADQTLKNNSSVSLINTSTIRAGQDYDANVTAALFDINNKENRFNWNGKFAVSQLLYANAANKIGYSHNLGFGKVRGRWNFQVGQELADEKYNINDMGILFNNNYVDHYFWSGYRWLKPTSWYNRIQVNYNLYHSMLYKEIPGQKVNSKMQTFNTNVNANLQFKNLWYSGGFISYSAEGNDFYEPRTTGYSFKTPGRINFNVWVETNRAKPYSANLSLSYSKKQIFDNNSKSVSVSHSYRFSDKLSIRQDLSFTKVQDDAGYYDRVMNGNELKDILFSRRDRKTLENVFSVKYNFNNKSGITFRARHYWSGVEQKQLFDLNNDGSLSPTKHNSAEMVHRNFNIFNVDAVYTWQIAPGSFVNIVWKDEGFLSNGQVNNGYFKNFERTFGQPHNNNISIKVIYFLDYLDLKKIF